MTEENLTLENSTEETPEAKAMEMSTIANMFAQASGSADEEILRIASNYALQLTPDQIYTVMKLKAFAEDYKHINPQLTEIVENFTSQWLEVKHFHESGSFILRVIDALSLKRIIPADATKVNVMK